MSTRPRQSVLLGLALLSLSALLFSSMGVLIRLASHTVDNPTVVFFRNLTGLLLLLPFYAWRGFARLHTRRFPAHLWRALVGLAAMYGFFYAIAHLKLSNAMVFTYYLAIVFAGVWAALLWGEYPDPTSLAGMALILLALLLCLPWRRR